MNINECGCRLTAGLGLDGDRCIHVIPRHHPTTHPWVGVSLQIISLQKNWIILIASTFIKFLVIWPDPTHQPTHQTMHPPMGGGFSTKFKSSNRIELSWLVQVLLNFDWFWGPPWGLAGGGLGWGGCGYVEGYTMHTHAHACTQPHAC